MPPKTTKQSNAQARRTEARRAFLFDHHSDQGYQLYRYFGKRIRVRRNELGLTQDSLAEQASISRGYLSQIEGGQRQVSLHLALRLSAVLQLSIDELLEVE